MKKNNNSQGAKRTEKNKKRIAKQNRLSKFERKQKQIRDNLLADFFMTKAVAAEAAKLANEELEQEANSAIDKTNEV